jgi:toxin ParE1/3/4
MPLYRLSTPALQDIVDILAYTEEQFGQAARERYEVLVFTALTDIGADPERLGSRARPELGDGVRVYHLRHSRTRAGTRPGTVRAPRHFVVYRHKVPDAVGVGRILHDAMDLERHRPEEFGDDV